MKNVNRREFIKKGSLLMGGSGLMLSPESITTSDKLATENASVRSFNSHYEGDHLKRIAFPIGGFGAGCFCLEGTGALSHFSVRNRPDVFHEPDVFAALSIRGLKQGARVLEGPVPDWKIFGKQGAANGLGGLSYGLPRFKKATFSAQFPFASILLEDEAIPMEIKIKGWSPFIPTDADHSSLPMGALEYVFKNTSGRKIEAVFSYHARNFMRIEIPSEWGGRFHPGHSVKSMKNGFVLSQKCQPGNSHYKGDFAIFSTDENTVVDHRHFRGGWFDSKTILWDDISKGNLPQDPPHSQATSASLYLPFELLPGKEVSIPLLFCWYVPYSQLQRGVRINDKQRELEEQCEKTEDCCPEYSSHFYQPWYTSRFKEIEEVSSFWRNQYDDLKQKTNLFSLAFHQQNLPAEVMEAISSNLSILKSPTVLRQRDGRMWAWEGCHDDSGCCHGSCTHVWNYAQAVPNLFPNLERSLRETEFNESQNEEGHQTFRDTLPIQENRHQMHAAADGQLGGIMKMYREWRISGNHQWLRKLWPKVKQSMNYCIRTWDPKGKGILEEPHHNTYDIEFWGPNGMCTSFYLGALKAMQLMGEAMTEDTSKYTRLYEKGKKFLEKELYDGEYFIHQIIWEGLEAPSPLEGTQKSINLSYSEEAIELMQKEGPKYQYGKGCLSDGILGCWIGLMCGMGDFVDREKVKSHLLAVHKYNLKKDLRDHINPQRPSFAMGNEGGLLLCTWPKGGKLTLPFVYSNEVWTGIEYQVASHLIAMGEVEKGLEIVKEARKRYDGRKRNPFDEFECGHWYARALASYGLIQSLTGLRYDAVDKMLYIHSQMGGFTAFLSTETGFGHVSLKDDQPSLKVVYGSIEVEKCLVSGEEVELKIG